MLADWNKRQAFEAESFDMTPIIDVVFLLIIFFMLVCQFIAAEQFSVAVPDAIASADPAPTPAPLTITVMTAPDGAVCAVGAERLGAVADTDLARLMTATIDEALAAGTGDTVRLRCDKAVTFGQVKPILIGIADSTAATLDWAVLAD